MIDSPTMTPHPTIVRRIDALIARHGSLRRAARAVGLDPGYLSHARRGLRGPGPRLLRALNLAEKIIYKTS